jgi:hypothetical protein
MSHFNAAYYGKEIFTIHAIHHGGAPGFDGKNKSIVNSIDRLPVILA